MKAMSSGEDKTSWYDNKNLAEVRAEFRLVVIPLYS